MEWHLRRIGWPLTTSLTCFKQETSLCTPTKQRIRPHLYTGLQHTSVAPWVPPGQGDLGCSGCFVVVQFHHSPFTFHSTCLLCFTPPPHTRWRRTWRQNRRRFAPPVLPPSAMPVTASPPPLLKSRGIGRANSRLGHQSVRFQPNYRPESLEEAGDAGPESHRN